MARPGGVGAGEQAEVTCRQLGPIGEDGDKSGTHGDSQRDPLAERAVEQALEVAQEASDVEHLGLDHLAAAEHEQLSRERRCTGEQICSRKVRLVGACSRHFLCLPRP